MNEEQVEEQVDLGAWLEEEIEREREVLVQTTSRLSALRDLLIIAGEETHRLGRPVSPEDVFGGLEDELELAHRRALARRIAGGDEDTWG